MRALAGFSQSPSRAEKNQIKGYLIPRITKSCNAAGNAASESKKKVKKFYGPRQRL